MNSGGRNRKEQVQESKLILCDSTGIQFVLSSSLDHDENDHRHHHCSQLTMTSDLTCSTAALVADVDGLFALCLGFQAGALQGAAAPVGQFVGSTHLVVALTNTQSRLALLVLAAFYALQSGTAAARCRTAAATQLSLGGGAHRAAAAGVPERAGGAALRRERGAPSRITRSAARTG